MHLHRANVAEFMRLFTALKKQADNSPERVADLAASDTGVMGLCKSVYFAADALRTSERASPNLFTEAVDPEFPSVWRDYEKRYELNLSLIVAKHSEEEFVTVSLESMDDPLKWKGAEAIASLTAADIEVLILIAGIFTHKFPADIEKVYPLFARFDVSPKDFIERIERGVEGWSRLKDEVGFDLPGILRRRLLIPQVLVPIQVSVKHGSAEKLSMLTYLPASP